MPILFSKIIKSISRILSYQVCLLIKFCLYRPVYFSSKGELIEINLKTICFKEIFIIGWIIIALIIWFQLMPINEQTPPPISTSKIDGAIHGLYSFCL